MLLLALVHQYLTHSLTSYRPLLLNCVPLYINIHSHNVLKALFKEVTMGSNTWELICTLAKKKERREKRTLDLYKEEGEKEKHQSVAVE